MSPDAIAALFTAPNGAFLCARWGRPIVPVVFGADDATLAVIKGAIEVIVALAGHKMAKTDVEMGANLMVFLVAEWDEVLAIPDLAGLVPGLEALVPRLQAQGANRYRAFRFDADGAIRAAFVFVRLDAATAAMAAEDLALAEAVHIILTWADGAFIAQPALARAQGVAVLRPEVAAVICAAYDPRLPPVSRDPAHALRLFARIPAT